MLRRRSSLSYGHVGLVQVGFLRVGGNKRSAHSAPTSPLHSPLISSVALAKIVAHNSEMLTLVQENNSEITNLKEENSILREKVQQLIITNETQTSRLATAILLVVEHIKTFPDAFSCVQEWISYNDVTFLEHFEDLGAGELIFLLRDIIEKTHHLVRPTFAKPTLAKIAPTISRICSLILDAVMPPGHWQFIPHWVWTWLIKVQTKSDRAVNIVAANLSGSPASNVKLSNILDRAADNITENEEFSKKVGNFPGDVVMRWDNAPASKQGYVKKDQSIYDKLKTRIITLYETVVTRDISVIDEIPFTQSIYNAANDPALWKEKFASVVAEEVLSEDPEAAIIIHQYVIQNIKTILQQMHDSGYKKGDCIHLRDNIPKPIIRQLKKKEQSAFKQMRDVFQQQCMVPCIQFASSLSSTLSNVVPFLLSSAAGVVRGSSADMDVEQAVNVDVDQGGDENVRNEDNDINGDSEDEDEDYSQDYDSDAESIGIESEEDQEDEEFYNDDNDLSSNEKLGAPDQEKVISDNDSMSISIDSNVPLTSEQAKIKFLGQDLNYKSTNATNNDKTPDDDNEEPKSTGHAFVRRCMDHAKTFIKHASSTYTLQVDVIRGKHDPGNPANTVVQERLTTRALVEGCVKGFVNDPKRLFICISTDLKAFMHYWWLGAFIRANHIIGVLHQDMNMMKAERKVEMSCDKGSSPCFSRLMNFSTLVAIRYYASAADTHKARQVSKVGSYSKLSHLVAASYDRDGAGTLLLTDDACAEAIFQELHLPGGGHTFRSLVSEVFDVNLPREIVHAAQSRRNHNVYMTARLKLIFLAHASNMREYGPAMTFDTIRFRCLYPKQMQEWHEKFFVYQTERQYRDGSPFQGWDNGMEVGIKDFKWALSGISDKVRLYRHTILFLQLKLI